jgi:SAM-dependent methyltransferase
VSGATQRPGACAPSAERNKGPILEVLRRVLPARGLALEIASGTGQHVVHFARALPELRWQPSEIDPLLRRSIAAWIAAERLANVAPPIGLDAERLPWPVAAADAVLAINLVHIAPWSTAQALVEGARRVLRPGGVLFLYGPYRRFGAHTAPSNERFDAELRAQDPRWGVRDMEAVAALAAGAGFALEEAIAMPANNFSLVFRARPGIRRGGRGASPPRS